MSEQILIEALEHIVKKSEEWQVLAAQDKLPVGCGEFPWWNLGDRAKAALKKYKKDAEASTAD